MNEMRRNDADEDTTAGKKNIPEVAIVILNWNGRLFLEKFLPSITRSVYPNKRIIVADNASTDDSVAFLRVDYPSVEVILNPANEGFAKGYNTALKQVQSDYYVLLNSDVEVTENWIQPVIDLMEKDQAIAACQPKILSYNNKKLFEYAGASGGWMDNFGYPFMRGRIFDVCEEDKGQYDDAQACFWASGAALFVKVDAYHEMGGMDEYFFAHQEEIDLCWRMQAAGYKIFVEPASVVYHVGGGTLPKGNSRKTYLNFRNNLIMMHKNMPFLSAVWKIPFRIMLNGVAACKSLLQGDGGYFRAISRAHRGYIRWILKGKKPRRMHKKNAELSGWYHGSVVWDHFVKKCKTFSEIIGRK
jgi:GT2 family glycosyltransferase